MPSVETFLRQDAAYRDGLIPPGARRVVVEAGVRDGWDRVVGCDALFITQDSYGHSAPAGVIAERLGWTPAAVTARVQAWLSGSV
jgi:transketolase